MTYGVQNDCGKIEKILVKHARDAYIGQENIDKQWQNLNYYECPDFNKALNEYEVFVEKIASVGCEIHYLPQNDNAGIDSIYPRDAAISTNKGIILCNMGKAERSGEPDNLKKYFKKINVPILGCISGNGKVEGGDIIWLDDILVVGRGYRTNDEGIRQLKEFVNGIAKEVITVPLVHWEGRADVFHLMSIISPIDKDLALVYSRLLPVPFRELLIDKGIQLVEVPDEEFESMGCNVLALAPRKCLMLEGNPITKNRLESAGAEVLTYSGYEISRKGAGGPTCMTRPFMRQG
ncbi:MAG: arginine deiminase family protein [candidate division Zixibacteria bacterium]